ncbi:hypothetical protein HPP92_022368 [Vanilla planifolia]|uniref:Protein kinase domain-containing protein n=1 Tax=Vanilla planifolia TaxID=51239 RepID=A0A835PV83_VANPL|nr:hypothetical protein HPP92_022368 [Vanilla planifolia]
MCLTGSFPTELCKLVNLTIIELDENRLSGSIPPEIGNCKALQRLTFPINFFTSELPKEVGNLTELVVFNISFNKLGGRIPPEIGCCKRLQRLDLSQNNFCSELPNEIGTLMQLEVLILSNNKLLGRIPSILGNLSRLTELQMGGNQFSGGIPRELGWLSSIQIAMNISHNSLSGTIPPELGNLALLEYLLLNNNQLTGEIPSTFVDLSSLLGLNLSCNHLSGPIPSFSLLQNLTSSSFLGNEALCGEPLPSCHRFSTLSSSTDSRSSGYPIGEIVAIIFAAIGGLSLVLIAVILFFLRLPVEAVAPLHDTQFSSAESGFCILPKDGFKVNDLVTATNYFDEDFVIGRGASGTVYKAILKSGLPVALKKLTSNREGSSMENSFRAEILTLGKIRHRNIVKLYGYCYHEGSNLLLYEYMSRGSLERAASWKILQFRLEYKVYDSSWGCTWALLSAPRLQASNHSPRYQIKQHSS